MSSNHSKDACPQGVKLPDGMMSQVTFTMVYEYEDVTTFFPTASTSVVAESDQYEPFRESMRKFVSRR